MSTGRLILPITDPILTIAGAPTAGATLTVTVAGSSTPASLFADAALSTPISNPQTSDSAGRFYDQTTVIWADAADAYDCVVDWPDGTSETYENLYLVGAASNVSGFAPINSPTFTGVPQAPTPSTNDNSAKLATTAYVQAQGFAALNSPALTGVPTAPTAVAGNSTTQLATTAFVTGALAVTAPTSTTSGYAKVAGLIFQWTTFSLGAGLGASQAVTWPITFTAAIIGTPWVACAGAATNMIGTTSPTAAGCTVVKGNADSSARIGTVYAIGY